MTIHFDRGQRMPLEHITQNNKITFSSYISGFNADFSVFGLDESRKLSDDRYFIFYNQKNSPEMAIMLNDDQSFTLDLQRIPVQIHHLVFAITTDEALFSELERGEISITDGSNNNALFKVSGDMFDAERAIILLELYRYKGQWRVKALGQGFNGGLKALIESLGGEVLDDSTTQSTNSPKNPVDSDLKQNADHQEIWRPLESSFHPSQNHTNCCIRCHKKSGFFSPLNVQGLCRKCVPQIQEGLERFRVRFLSACADGIMELHEWHDLQNTILSYKLNAEEALMFVRPDALILLERTMTIARADGIISKQEEEIFNRLVSLLMVPETMIQHLKSEIDELKQAAQLREGHLPTIESTLILNSEEIAHLECPATYRHVTATRSRDIPGRIIVTNRQIHFVSQNEGGWNIQYPKVLRIEELSDGVKLELGVKKGSGYYHTVPQPIILGATLDALVRINKRLLLMPQTERASRKVPQKVKIAVWQRDQGQCVECHAKEYLEFDHVIPHSLGGASTEGNLQLLCRRCNLKKSNQI